jgi:tetratricopeptide (TPR) repeat protein
MGLSRTLRFLRMRSIFPLMLAVIGGAGFIDVARAAVVVQPGLAVDSTRLRSECEYGIELALSGADSSADSAFISLLTHSPNDARALNNLGNIRLFRGDLDVALVYYEQAGEADSSDAGIVLNEATAHMMRGDEDEAQNLAVEGVRRAGGLGQAALLLGLKTQDSEGEKQKAGDRPYVRKDEVLELLRAAAAGVPADSSRAKQSLKRGQPAGSRKRVPTWRSAAARGADGSDAEAVVYWKQ